jgi:hypothetical protein
MCLRKLRKYLGAPALNDGSHAHQTVRNANSLRRVRPWVRAGAGIISFTETVKTKEFVANDLANLPKNLARTHYECLMGIL